ncbi:MAG: PIG-L family deacetylase [Chloroflexi bacterium]|nr:PIG-L family deacetylase [Chloroflexota bacterium]
MQLITKPARKALVVTPHPDDAEGGCGATMAKWIKESGSEFIVVMCTNGDKGTSDRELQPAELAATREKEQREASGVLGVKDVVFLAHPDGGLEDDLEFRGQVVRLIRQHQPDTIFCIDPYRSKSHTHRDHRMSGQVALDAAFTYAWSYLHFPEQISQEGLKPHRVERAFLWASESPDCFVELEEANLELKAEALSRHVSQMHSRTTHDRMERIRRWSGETGEKAGVPFAEGFRRIQFGIGSLEWQFLDG